MAHAWVKLDLSMVPRPFRRPAARMPAGQSSKEMVQGLQADQEHDELRMCRLLWRMETLRLHHSTAPDSWLGLRGPHPTENHGL